MSRSIEINNKYYRVVRTIGLFNKLHFRKMVVCDEEGHIVEDEEITRRCFWLIMSLVYYEFSQEGIFFDANYKESQIRSDREWSIDLFQKIWGRLDPVLSKSEHELMAYHMYFLRELLRLGDEMVEPAKEIIDIMSKIENVTDDTYPQHLIEHYIAAASKNLQLNKEFAALIIEAREKAGTKISEIILRSDHAEYLKDLGTKNIRNIPADINGAVSTAEKFVEQTKKERAEEIKWLGD